MLEKSISHFMAQIKLGPKAMSAFKKDWRFMGGKRDNFITPGHAGYRQMRIIREKQKDFAEAIRLCQKAHKEGWGDDWDKQIEKLESKMKRQKPRPDTNGKATK